MELKMKNVKCNICGHHFETKAQDKNIQCPKCKSKESFGYNA